MRINSSIISYIPSRYDKICYYEYKLLNKIIINNEKITNKVDIKKIKKSILYAKKYHGDQKRLTGEPFYSHPLEVAFLISDHHFTTDIIISSVLHDTLEDTSLTKEMIGQHFGMYVANQVEDLSRMGQGRKISSGDIVDKLWKQKKYDTLLIKLFDRIHNMQTINAKTSDKIKKINNETIQSFIPAAIYTGSLEIIDRLTDLCYKNL